jgi:hypothetical protein
MEKKLPLPRPTTLTTGSQYRRLVSDEAGSEPRFTLVKFLTYTACPAFVIVTQGNGRLRCSRADLFDLAGAPASD